MTNDTKAPERIWASYIRTQDGMWIGKHAAQDAPYKGATGYIRQDLHPSLVADDIRDRIEELEQLVASLEDKLAKAVEALEWCAKADHSIMARFALAELKGNTDDLPSPELKNGPEG